MATVWQYITASGVLVVAMTAIVTKVVNRRFDEMERREKDRARLEKIMICRTDKMSGMVELMADKLHEQGIINGDLEQLRQAYAVTDREYEEYLRELLARQMR
jgi:hypothetical protein